MNPRNRRMLVACGLGMAMAAALPLALRAEEKPKHALPVAKHGGTVIGMCDGKTSLEVDLKPGESLSPERAQSVSAQLMTEWRKANPGASWDVVAVADTGAKAGQGPAGAPPSSGQSAQHGTYEAFTSRDEAVWAEETKKFVDEGNAIFHSPSKLGGTVGVSCGNCHPNGANTHPETYPKYQVQLQRVALLRDMINWCVENPVKGKALADDDPKMRALEAYILSTRKGVALEYGKH